MPSAIRTAAVDPGGSLWISLASTHTYVYDSDGDKRRIIQFRGAGTMAPSDLFFTKTGRLIVAPGCYTFAHTDRADARVTH